MPRTFEVRIDVTKFYFSDEKERIAMLLEETASRVRKGESQGYLLDAYSDEIGSFYLERE